MRNFIRALMASVAKVFRFVWDPIAKVGRMVVDVSVPAITGAGQIAAATVGAVASVPAAVVSSLLSPFRQQVAPAPRNENPVAKAVADNAKASEEQRAVEATRAALAASVDAASVVRRFAAAAVDGRATPSLAALPDDVRIWVTNLSNAQLTALAESDFAQVQRHLTGSVPLAGVPSVGSITAKEPEPIRSADIVRPVFRKPENGYARPAAAGMDANAAVGGFEKSKAFDPPQPLPREPMAMSSGR